MLALRSSGRLEVLRPLELGTSNWAKTRWIVALLGGLLIMSFGPAAPSAVAATTPSVELGQASSYAVLSGASVANTVNAEGAPHTTLRGDLGVSANAQPTGFPPGIVTGTTRVGSTATQAHNDLIAAYNEVAARPGGAAMAGDLIGLTLSPGLHTNVGAVANTGTVVLDGGGNPNAVFVFKIGGAFSMAAGARVTLTNGTQASHVFWQAAGAGSVGAKAKFAGTLMALDAIAVGAGTEFNGRALALNGAITLDSNEFYSGPPVVTLNGGASAITNQATPTITGTTDVVEPALVTVTIAGQILTATPSAGTWSVTPTILANGTYPIVASVSDGAGNPGSATQQLTIDTVLPKVTINGGPSVTTNNPTRTIAGTSDAAPGTIVRLSVDSQTLTALVQPGGAWNVSPTPLIDGTRTITASVTDPAGNVGTSSQTLTVNTNAPTVTITGGANALTDHATPEISGTANVAPGSTVTVTLADQTLTGLVQSGGAWSVTAAALSNGPHRIVMSVSDAAGNGATYTQVLTVDTVSPFVAITGGATATTDNLAPTIAGTSDAAPGTIVTVSIAGQTMTTLVQANGTWNATASAITVGTWLVIASVADPAGNVGSSTQALTIAVLIPPVSGGIGQTGSTGGTGGAGKAGGNGAAGTVPPLTVTFATATFTAPRGKPLGVSFVVSGKAKVTLTVLHGKKVVAKVKTTCAKAGRCRITWNGKIKGRPAPKGTYNVIIQGVSPRGASFRHQAKVHIT
jgi:hypothetical protein